MTSFDIDYDSLVPQVPPVDERTDFNVGWLQSLVSPVKWLYGLFSANRSANLYDLAHNGQVCYLQAVLNDTFDSALRRITVGDPAYNDPIYLFLEDELKPQWLGLESEVGTTTYPDPQWLYLDTECYDGSGTQFIVHVPVGLAYDANWMRALINVYRLASKSNYSIVSP